ncbi:MoxR-like ATPase [Terriglobus roseus DSM 18391]|uniref:MoxR-like ATPase n=1 Tax=Terriglobus roseus (strain DSM 18391 / NRRL B-41598 / KBS 63) TaxID=926566 RepID=I3ZDK9_TERRK|nr:MoxR family ATPase [Terriglobus roseus]AFL87327.1 MoxR-like ATPase [Terriglobus roseus DSM 18391]
MTNETSPSLELFRSGRAELGKVLAGQQELVEQALLTLLCGGHALIEGVPGVAKTLAVKTLARFLALDFRRVQGTPDTMPADILGTNVFSPKTGEFSLHRGPVFTQFLLADEVNRMPPRTQAALLESMEERQVTLDGDTHVLDAYFTVFATQNPLEFEGTYPLPEAQLDRFLMKIRVDYPAAADERTVLERHHRITAGHRLEDMEIAAVDAGLLQAARAEVRAVQVEPALFDYLLAVVRRTREWPALSLGASPRAAAMLLLVAKAYAARDGRTFLLPDDVKAAAPPTLRHRLLLKPEAELEGFSTDRVVADILAAVPLPK